MASVDVPVALLGYGTVGRAASALRRSPTFSISVAASSLRASARLGLPLSISAIHSRANEPSWIASSTFFMFSFTCGSTTRGPTAIEPYSAVSEIE